MAKGNIIDVDWVLLEETGMLSYEGFRLVRSRPRQRILVSCGTEDATAEILERYRRILDDREDRGLNDG